MRACRLRRRDARPPCEPWSVRRRGHACEPALSGAAQDASGARNARTTSRAAHDDLQGRASVARRVGRAGRPPGARLSATHSCRKPHVTDPHRHRRHEAERRTALLRLLDGGRAHAPLASTLLEFPRALRGKKPRGAPHSAWELLEHLRIAQRDICGFSRDPDHPSPPGRMDSGRRARRPPSPARGRRACAPSSAISRR
jgi:hypothetical protein